MPVAERRGGAHTRFVRSRFLLAVLVFTACASVTTSAGGPVWSASSASIRLELHMSFDGTAAWEKKRSELTPDQLSILDSLASGPPIHGTWSDPREIFVRIANDDRSLHDYRVAVHDEFGQGFTSDDLPVIASAAFLPFLDSVHCLLSNATSHQAERVGVDPITGVPRAPWTDAPDASDDPGCFHGIQGQETGEPTWVRAQVSAAGTYAFTLEPCTAPGARLRLRSADGSTELAVSPVFDATCASLTYAVAAAGPLLVGIEGGAFSLRIRRQ